MAPIKLCVRNIPCKLLDADMEHAITMHGLDPRRYELQLPKRSRRHGRMNNFGYGFLTCQQEQDADLFIRIFQGYRFDHIQSVKRLSIEAALSDDQGQWRNSTMASPYNHHSSGHLHPTLSGFTTPSLPSCGSRREWTMNTRAPGISLINRDESRCIVPEPADVPPTRLR
eukprot:TRINITY_DN17886_c0_g1_i2.p1 TRINITY_DN17886_c0_g1~~TRINITY_DN17886_c0_g1_i2.p1  ORF type:complete len:170 (+),score=9.93 TRINITY_DN17886_c0_g1_i2:71-580(+)